MTNTTHMDFVKTGSAYPLSLLTVPLASLTKSKTRVLN